MKGMSNGFSRHAPLTTLHPLPSTQFSAAVLDGTTGVPGKLHSGLPGINGVVAS
jgi:hypothetical protein